CQEFGANVSLDGKLLFVAPGAMEQTLLPGEHQVVAVKPGFATTSEVLVLVAGRAKSYEIKLRSDPKPLIVRTVESAPCAAEPAHSSIPTQSSWPSLITHPITSGHTTSATSMVSASQLSNSTFSSTSLAPIGTYPLSNSYSSTYISSPGSQLTY